MVLIPDKIIDGLKYSSNWQKIEAKSRKFAEIIGKEEMTGKEIYEVLIRENIVSDGFWGKRKTRRILNSIFPVNPTDYYVFEKIKTIGSNSIKYKLYLFDEF